MQLLAAIEAAEKDFKQRVAVVTRAIGVGEEFNHRLRTVDQRIQVCTVNTGNVQCRDVPAHLFQHCSLARQDAWLLKILVTEIARFVAEVGKA